MKYQHLGKTSLIVSRLSLGTMTFSESEKLSAGGTFRQNIADSLVHEALEAGVNLFDCADCYHRGESEIMLGRALGKQRQDVILTSKVGFRHGDRLFEAGLSAKNILHSVEQSLKRLSTDYLDILFAHIPDPYTSLDETLRAFEDIVRQGKARYIGFSNFPAWKAAKMLSAQSEKNYQTFTCAQLYYSLVGRDLDHEYLSFLKEESLGLMVWSPLAGGYLSGKYSTFKSSENARRKTHDFPPVDQQKAQPIMSGLFEIAEKKRASPAQVALSWLLAKDFVSSVIIGAKTTEQLSDNLSSVDCELSSEEVLRLDKLSEIEPIYPGYMLPFGYDQKIKKFL